MSHLGRAKPLLAVAAIALLANIAFAVITTRIARPVVISRTEQTSGVIEARRLDERRVLVATLSNELLILDGSRVAQQIKFPALIGGLGVAGSLAAIYVGTSDGKLSVLHPDLQLAAQVPVSGRVVALTPARTGGVFVAHGIGAFSDRYWVSYYPTPTPKAAFDQRVEFTISALDATGDLVAFSTANGRVGALRTTDGHLLWQVTVSRPVLRLVAVGPTNTILAGDDQGNLTLLSSATGDSIWVVNVSSYPIYAVAYDASSETYLAGDGQGRVYALDAAGHQIFSGSAATSAIEAFLPTPTGLIAIPRDGRWSTVEPAAIRSADLAERLRLAWDVVDVMLLAILAITAVVVTPRWRARVRVLGLDLRRSRTAYLFVLPSFALIVLFSYYPAALAFYYSFTNFSSRNVTAFIGLENYLTIVRDDTYFREGIVNVVLILLTGVAKVLTIPLLAAELVYWVKNSVHRYVFRTLVIFPAVVPSLVTTLLWRMIYDPNVGLLNELLRAVGLGQLQRAWLGDEHTAIWAVIGAGFPFLSAFAFLIYLGGLLNINSELFDSAQIDGATWIRRFLSIDLPLLESQFRLLLFFAFAGALQGFANIYIFTQGGPGSATYVPSLEMYFKISDGDFGYASAIGVILFAVIFLGTVGILRYRREATVI